MSADTPAAAHPRDWRTEYAAVREAVGIARRTDHGQLRMWGRDPAKMLHGLITNDLLHASPDRGVYAAVLTPKGRTLAEVRAFHRPVPASGPAELLVDVPCEALPGLREHLKKFVPPLFARSADVSDQVAMLGAYGPRSRELLERALGAPVPELAEDGAWNTQLAAEPVLVVRTLQFGENGYDLFLAAAAAPALWSTLLAQGTELGVRPVGFAALEALRIEAGRPRYGRELTEETIPTEAFETTGLMPRAISFTKGCYTGQEVIVRIAHRGHVNRHLRGLRLGELAPPPFRTPLFHPESGKQVGWVTSAAESPALGETVALAYVRREVEPGATVRVETADGAPAAVVTLPLRGRGNGSARS